ncbi:uncharacterized protein LY89DRAFT_55677 [Mollisia scopiformis]|uniref:Secreted protein n=1 Tax=Mollisia scopiformis TaxID=149040 RepID=A0A194XBK1_MOLSC|nr:uncharacterized protein LY89DRAFT_55677 [Mollisia scopiformis]KUJ17539.1 hypothetical protein LY89DRAFT_55677 [Mollisia scopiformis]
MAPLPPSLFLLLLKTCENATTSTILQGETVTAGRKKRSFLLLFYLDLFRHSSLQQNFEIQTRGVALKATG